MGSVLLAQHSPFASRFAVPEQDKNPTAGHLRRCLGCLPYLLLSQASLLEFTSPKMKKIIAAALACLLLQGCDLSELAQPPRPGVTGGEIMAIVRPEGFMVLVPEIGGPGTYGYYIVPNELGRQSPNRFNHRRNFLQINFLPPDAFPRGFAQLSVEQKLRQFFITEAQHQRATLRSPVIVLNETTFRSGGVTYRRATFRMPAPLGMNAPYMDYIITARVAGQGIMHGTLNVTNPAAAPQSQALLMRMLNSFRLVNRPLTQAELIRLTQTR